MIIQGDWVEVPHEGEIRKAEVLQVYELAYSHVANAQTFVVCQDADNGKVFESSLESCVSIDDD